MSFPLPQSMNDADAAKGSVNYFTEREFFYAARSNISSTTGQVASRSQLQSTGIGCSSKQDQGTGRDRRSGDFRIGEVGFEADCVGATRGLVTKSIQAVEFEHRPGRFDAIQPPTNLRILEEAWCNHDTPTYGLSNFGVYGTVDRCLDAGQERKCALGSLRIDHRLVHVKCQRFDALGESLHRFCELSILLEHLH